MAEQHLNLSNKPATVRREDWRHRVDNLPHRSAKRIPNEHIPPHERRARAENQLAQPQKGPVYPSQAPPIWEPTQVDWRAGRIYDERAPDKVRLVVEADIPSIASWAMDKFIDRYPRCYAETVIPFLKLATRERRFRFLITANGNAVGLFEATRSPWEPELSVHDHFVVAKHPRFAATDSIQIYLAALQWAEDIKAVEFNYGSSTGVDITPLAKRIGYDVRAFGFMKRLQPLPLHEGADPSSVR